MASKFTNNAVGVLAAGISAAATALTVNAGQGALFPALSGAEFAWGTLYNAAGTLEIVKITGRTGDSFTIVRGQQGTTAAAWLSGDKLDLRITADSLNSVLTTEGGTATGPLNATALSAGTGAVTGGSAAITGSNAIITLNKTGAANAAAVRGQMSASLRWSIEPGNSDAESTGNAGSNFAIARYSDAGALIDVPFSINRATGVTSATKLTVSSGPLTVTAGGAVITAGGLTISAGGASITGALGLAGTLNVTGGGVIAVAGVTAITASGDINAIRNASPSTGAVFWGNSGTRYIYWDSVNWTWAGGGALILNHAAVHLAFGPVYVNTCRDYNYGQATGLNRNAASLEFIVAGAQRGYVDSSSNIVANGNFVVSDRKRKTAIKAADVDALVAGLLKLKVKEFEYKQYRGVRRVGFIAQDVQKHIPLAVSQGLNGLVLDPQPIVAALVAHNQRLEAALSRMEKRLAKLEARR